MYEIESEDCFIIGGRSTTFEKFDLDGEGMVAVVAVSVAVAAACLGFESVSAVPLVSSSSSEQKS